MSDPVASLLDRTGILSVALDQWTARAAGADEAAARRAASAVLDAIDALLRDLYLVRGRLVQEMRRSDGAAGRRVA